MKKTTGCNYQGHEFGSRDYPDSVCVDGRLFDGDNCDGRGRLYEPTDYYPCPMCNREEAVRVKIDALDGDGIPYIERRKRARAIMRRRVEHFRETYGKVG